MNEKILSGLAIIACLGSTATVYASTNDNFFVSQQTTYTINAPVKTDPHCTLIVMSKPGITLKTPVTIKNNSVRRTVSGAIDYLCNGQGASKKAPQCTVTVSYSNCTDNLTSKTYTSVFHYKKHQQHYVGTPQQLNIQLAAK